MSVENDCPICDPSRSANEQFATARVAEHILKKASNDEGHQAWIDEHTENGTLAEIRTVLREESPPK